MDTGFSGWGYVLIVLLFGGSIFVHELGHFLAAKAFGLKVLRFSIGFGPQIAQWTGKDGCKYAISLLPLGGYVAIPQLADMGRLEGAESEDAEKSENLPKAGCFAKICVSLAGAAFNVLLAFVLALVVSFVGVPENEILHTSQIGALENAVSADGETFESPAKKAGLREGDVILSIDGQRVGGFEDVAELVAMGSGRDAQGNPLVKIEAERGGKKLSFDVRAVLVKTNLSTGDEIRMIGVQPAVKMVVGALMKNSPAAKAGIQKGDEILSVNGERIYSPAHMSKFLETLADKSVRVGLKRNGREISANAVPKRVVLSKPLLEVSGREGKLRLLETESGAGKMLKVFSASPELGLSPADALYKAGGSPVHSAEDARGALAQKTTAVLHFAGADFELKDVRLDSVSVRDIPAKTRVMLGYSLAESSHREYPTVAEQFSKSLQKVFDALSSLLNPHSDVGISSLAGPVDIGRIIYRLTDTSIMLVVSFTVLLNINLAVLNLLPIPVLDGGHIMFALLEKARGKPVPMSVFAALQTVFAVLFLALMGYVVYLGIMRWNGDNRLEKQNEIYTQYKTEIKF